ncbi:MAG: VWA domain-containing protein [Holophagales bacterium]|nr:VWA domain-containing protein [Holophagales bacterium]MYC10556.1 VWA domain-containing protein [Holophagales bacterium]
MRLGSAAAVTFCIAAVPVWGQEEDWPDLFSEVLDVRVVNVEVVVTDRRGNRIRGLEASDFELLVDREPLPISYFTEVDEGVARSSFDDDVARVPSVVADEPVGTSYLIFIDDLHAVRQHRDRVLSRLEQDLVLLNPADRVAVVAFDGRNVSRLTDWTNSRQEISEALVLARQRRAGGRARLRNWGAQENQVRKAVMAATATVRAFAVAPGRKVALLLTDGWSQPARALTIMQAAPPWGDTESLYNPLVHAANQVGFSLYPIDLPGFRDMVSCSSAPLWNTSSAGNSWFSEPGVGASWRGSPRTTYSTADSRYNDDRGWTLGTSTRPLRIPSPSLQGWCRRENGHEVLRFLARQTGGLPMLDGSRDRALGEAAEDTRTYYWLGFEAPRDQNDELHDIKVRLPGRRGLRVRTRKHFLDISRSTEVTMLVEGALAFDDSPGKDVLDARFGTPRKAGFRKISVPIEVSIPLDDVQLLPMDGRWMNELEFRVTLIDEHGDRSETPVDKIPIHGSRAPSPGDTFVYETELVMRRREHRYVAAVYDPLSGAILSASGDVGPATGTDTPNGDAK